MVLTVYARRAGNAYAQLANPGALVKPGKNMTFFIKIPTGQSWDYVQPFAQDGPARNYRWSALGYVRQQVLPTEWNSVVVKVPSDFATSGGKIGVELHATGPGTIQL